MAKIKSIVPGVLPGASPRRRKRTVRQVKKAPPPPKVRSVVPGVLPGASPKRRKATVRYVEKRQKRQTREKIEGLNLKSKGKYRPALMSRDEKRRARAVRSARNTYKLLERVEQRQRLYAKNPQYADDRISAVKPGTRSTSVAGLSTKDLSDFASKDTLVGAAGPGFARLGVISAKMSTAPYHVARATVEDPKKVIPATAKGVRDMLVGLPGAAYESASNPTAIPDLLAKDIARRYKPLIEGDTKKFRERIKKEGAAAEALDFAGVSAVGGRVVAPALRTTKRGKEFMDKPRPKLRTTGGPAKKQKLSGNAIVVGGQRTLDTRRRKKTEKRVERADKGGTRTGALDRSVRPGEVVPLRRKKVLGNREVARRKSRGVQALKAEQAREVHTGARRNVARLDKHERKAFKYALQLGLPADPKRAKVLLERRRAQIVAAREAGGTDIPVVLRETNDELRVIDELLAEPERAFTVKLREVADQERSRSIRVGSKDPGLAIAQQRNRRYAPVAEFLGVERRGSKVEGPTTDDLGRAERKARSALRRAEQRLAKARRDEAHAIGRARVQATAARRMVRRGGRLGKRRTDLTKAQGEALFRARTGRLEAEMVVRRAQEGVEAAAVAAKRGETRLPGESMAQFTRRVQKAADQEGLARPAYFRSQKRPESAYSAFALGGTKAVAEDKAYKGALFRTGREDTSPGVHLTSLAKNIKRKHNWNTVADNFAAHTFEWGRNKTIAQALDELDARGVNAGDVAFYNPKKYREARQSFERAGDDTIPIGDDPAPVGLDRAVDEAAVDYRGLSTKPPEFKNTSGWSVIPKDVFDEIHADTRPSSAVGRSWDVLKGKQSRILLGTNPPWLAFQAASNVLLTGLAKTGPIDAAKAQVWWRRLDEDTKAAVEPYVGVSASHVDVQQTKLGATADNRIVNAYRAFKESPFWHANLKIPAVTRRTGRQGPSVSGLNPLNVLFRADSAQNNFFRRSVLYSQAKRDAYRRMGQNVSGAQKAQDRLHGLFTLGPEDQIKAVLRDRDALEEHAGYVQEMLGDYTTYTAKERRILGRTVMFYGFMRFSLNFAFRTMPVKHPIMTNIIANLSRMQTEEVRELLGGDELPFALGRVYIRKDGKLQVVDLTRLNPATNTLVTASSDPRWTAKLLASLPPMVTTALDAAYQKEAFTGKTMKVENQSGYAARERESTGEGLGNTNLARFGAARVLKLAFPYRVWEGVAFGGESQGADSLAWDTRPTRYKTMDPEFAASVKAEKQRIKKLGPAGVIKEEMFPFLPHATRDPEIAKSIRERRNPKKATDAPVEDWRKPSSGSVSGDWRRR